jgi:hypothetical protein
LAVSGQPRIGDNAEFEAALGVKFAFEEDTPRSSRTPP